LETPSHSAYLAVALATEMAVTEALELQDGLHRKLGRDLSAVVVNALLPRRFTTEELQRIESLDGRGSSGAERAAIDSAVHAARSVHDRARFQQNQLARLRRRSFDVVGVPFVWGSQLDQTALAAVARRLERKL
jgi:hypothetical protein